MPFQTVIVQLFLTSRFLALTVPITSCECERSFSQLKLIKSSRRSTMTSERLGIDRKECEKLQKSSSKMQQLAVKFNQMHPRRMKLPGRSIRIASFNFSHITT